MTELRNAFSNQEAATNELEQRGLQLEDGGQHVARNPLASSPTF
jgi:hypothetical protein